MPDSEHREALSVCIGDIGDAGCAPEVLETVKRAAIKQASERTYSSKELVLMGDLIYPGPSKYTDTQLKDFFKKMLPAIC